MRANSKQVFWMFAGALLVMAASTQADSRPSAPAAASAGVDPEVPFASASASAVAVPSAADAWGGIRTGKEATLSDRVVDYRIQATLDPVKHRIDGQERLSWRNRSDREIRTVYLHLYLNAFDGSGSTFFTERNTKGFEFRSDLPTMDGSGDISSSTR